jgi:hypothetical protein
MLLVPDEDHTKISITCRHGEAIADEQSMRLSHKYIFVEKAM